MSPHAEPAGSSPPTLAALINNATQQQHINLNRTIGGRLTLALPPHTSQPDLYLLGMSQVADIFFAFESLWDEITSTSHMSSLDNSAYGTVDAYPHPREDALISGLRSLRPIGLARSTRLRDDLRKLRRVCGVEDLEHVRSDVVDGIVMRMEEEVRQRPHLLVAYAFSLYLAVLSGGRHIRHELCKQGLGFWTGAPQAETKVEPVKKTSAWNWSSPVGRLGSAFRKIEPEDAAKVPDHKTRIPKKGGELLAFEASGLSFWFFPGPLDGEDLRKQFKDNLADLSKYISPSQEDEIVAEAQAIFSRIGALVEELDGAVAATKALGSPTIDASRHETQQAEALEEVRVEKAEASTAPAIALPMLRDRNGAPLPWYLGLGILMCGVSYAAMVYGYSWST